MNPATPDDPHRSYEQRGEVEPKSVQLFGEVSELAKHGDPSRPEVTAVVLSEEEKLRQAVVWVRPTELIPMTTGRVVGRGIDFQAELARRTRALPVEASGAARDSIRDRTGPTAPLSAFGSSAVRRSPLDREAIGRE